jgi:DNA-binding PucR family transcriptional regulator
MVGTDASASGSTGNSASTSAELAELAAWAEEGRLADEVLGPVLGLPPDDRATVLDTLNAYLDHAGSTERAAEVLYCHPNTVRYRLRRLQELTGRSLSDPRGIAELAAAAYALRLNTATALWQRRQPAAAVNGSATDRAQAGTRR